MIKKDFKNSICFGSYEYEQSSETTVTFQVTIPNEICSPFISEENIQSIIKFWFVTCFCLFPKYKTFPKDKLKYATQKKKIVRKNYFKLQAILAQVTWIVTITAAVLAVSTIIVHPLTMDTAQNRLDLFAVMGTAGVVVLKVHAPVHKQVWICF